MNPILIDFLISLLLSLLIAGFAWIYYKKHSKDKKKIGKSDSIYMDSTRDMFERKIYELTTRLVQSEERWRDVNHLLVSNKFSSENYSQGTVGTYYSEFLKANGLKQSDLVVDPRLIFVLTPYSEVFFKEYMVIRDLCSSMGFTCYRGDETAFKSEIFMEMLKYIVKAGLIIANVNGRNPNVMYELGIAHAIDKNVILISEEPENLPVDIKSKRFIFYKSSDELIPKLKDELNKFNKQQVIG